MKADEKNERSSAVMAEHPSEKGSGTSAELPPPKVLLTRNAIKLWVYMALAAAPLTFAALLIYSATDLPNQWGFHFAAWAQKGPLRIPVLICGILKFVLARTVFGVPIGNTERKMLPEVLAYYPRTLKEAGRTLLALLHTIIAFTVIYLGELLIFVEVYGILSK